MVKNKPLSVVEISSKNLIHNIKQFKSFLNKKIKVSVAVKGNAYGHGLVEVARAIENHVDYLQVNSLEELRLLRKVTKKEVLLLGFVNKANLPEAINLGCQLAVFSLPQLLEVENISKKLNMVTNIHVAVDASFGREGLMSSELPKFFLKLNKCASVKLEGLYSHFANADDLENISHNQKQIDVFENSIKLAREFGFENFQTHISATAGSLVFEKSKGSNDLVRLGLGAYGLWPSSDLEKVFKNKINLKPVLSWKTKVAQVKILPKGSNIGYGLTYKTKSDQKVALIPQGYSDGLNRNLSNRGHVLIRGQKCKILGRVAMNMFIVDVDQLGGVRMGDEVVILGKQGRSEISADDLASLLNTINYEVLTSISPLLPRSLV